MNLNAVQLASELPSLEDEVLLNRSFLAEFHYRNQHQPIEDNKHNANVNGGL